MTKAQVASAAQLQAALASYWGRAAVPLPVIVAGDFNTLSYKHWDPRIAPPDAFEQLTSPKPSAKKRAGADRGACRFPLRSAYADVQGAEPCYTSVDPAFPHCIDYVFYNGCGVLRPSRVLGVVDRKQQLPAAPWPSDHLCLVAAFDLTGAGPSPCKFGDRCRFFAGAAAATTTLKYRSSRSATTTGLLGAARERGPPKPSCLTTFWSSLRRGRSGRRATLYTPQKNTTISVHEKTQDHRERHVSMPGNWTVMALPPSSARARDDVERQSFTAKRDGGRVVEEAEAAHLLDVAEPRRVWSVRSSRSKSTAVRWNMSSVSASRSDESRSSPRQKCR